MVVADVVTPRMSNQVQYRTGKESYEQLNALCPKCKSPLVRRIVQGNLLAPNFSFGLISTSHDDSFIKALHQPGGNRQKTPTERFLCFTSTELTSSAEEDSSPFDCCSIARAKKLEKKPNGSPSPGLDNGEQENIGRAVEEGSDVGNIIKNDIRSELSFCVTCQAYVATERVISEHQQALSELVDRLAVDDEGTAFMNLYVTNESEMFEEESKTPIDMLTVLKEDYSYGKRNHENERDDPSGLSTVITSNRKATGENKGASVIRDQKSTRENANMGKKRAVPGVLDSSVKSLDVTKRREIIAEALGRKLLEGYSLTSNVCKACGVPLMEQSGTVSCFACPALQLHGVAKTLNYRPREFSGTHRESDGTQEKPQVPSDSFKEPKFGTKSDDCFLPKDESKPMFPYPQNGMKYEFKDSQQRYQKTTLDRGHKGFQGDGTLDATPHPHIKPPPRLKYADCKYCGLPCFEIDCQGECKECRAVLYSDMASTKLNMTSGPSFSQSHSRQGPKLEKLNSIVRPKGKFDIGREVKESRGDKNSFKERDEATSMSRDAYRQHKTEQFQKNVNKMKSEKKVGKKKYQKHVSRSSFEKLEDGDLDESGQHHWWVEAISAEDIKLGSISVPLNMSSFDGSLNSHSIESCSQNLQEEDAKNESKFEVLDGTKPWNSIPSESFESSSIQQSNIMDFNEKKDRPMMDVYAPIDMTSQTSFSLDTQQNSSMGLIERLNSKQKKLQYAKGTAVLKTAYTEYVREGYIPPSDFLPLTSPQIDYDRVRYFEENNKIEALQSSRHLPSLDTVDVSLTPVNDASSAKHPLSLDALGKNSSHEILRLDVNGDTKRVISNERTSAEICRLLGCGWKLASDLNCRKCLMPMMRKIDVNVLKCASCDVDTNQSLDPLPSLKKKDYQEIQLSKTPSSSLSKWNVSGSRIHPNPASSALSKLRIGKKLLENWSFVTSRTCDECGGPIMRAPSTQYEGCINSKCRCSNLNVDDPPKTPMTQMKQTKNFKTMATLSNYSTNVSPMSYNRESEPQIYNSNAAQFVSVGKIDPSDVNSSTDDDFSGKGALEKLKKKYLKYSDDVSTVTIQSGEYGETTIERKLQAQINMAERLGAQKSQFMENDDFSAEFDETDMSKELEVNIENNLEAQMEMADFLWSLHKN